MEVVLERACLIPTALEASQTLRRAPWQASSLDIFFAHENAQGLEGVLSCFVHAPPSSHPSNATRKRLIRATRFASIAFALALCSSSVPALRTGPGCLDSSAPFVKGNAVLGEPSHHHRIARRLG